MRTELVLDALHMALAPRQPAPGLVWHRSGQPVRLACFGQQAPAAGIAQSMGSRGDCFDNAVAETFFATLKKELTHRRSWPQRAGLRAGIGLAAVITFVLRALPFTVIELLRSSRLAAELAARMPAGLMLILVVYLLRDVPAEAPAAAAVTLAAAIIVVALHWWRSNALLSIFTGTST